MKYCESSVCAASDIEWFQGKVSVVIHSVDTSLFDIINTSFIFIVITIEIKKHNIHRHL